MVSRPRCAGCSAESRKGPFLTLYYLSYTYETLVELSSRMGWLASHANADDIQVYSSCHPSEAERLRTCIIDCISAIRQWTYANRLSLNPRKTGCLWVSTPRGSHPISRNPITIDGVDIVPMTELLLLGVLLNATLSLAWHWVVCAEPAATTYAGLKRFAATFLYRT